MPLMYFVVIEYHFVSRITTIRYSKHKSRWPKPFVSSVNIYMADGSISALVKCSTAIFASYLCQQYCIA